MNPRFLGGLGLAALVTGVTLCWREYREPLTRIQPPLDVRADESGALRTVGFKREIGGIEVFTEEQARRGWEESMEANARYVQEGVGEYRGIPIYSAEQYELFLEVYRRSNLGDQWNAGIKRVKKRRAKLRVFLGLSVMGLALIALALFQGLRSHRATRPSATD